MERAERKRGSRSSLERRFVIPVYRLSFPLVTRYPPCQVKPAGTRAISRDVTFRAGFSETPHPRH